MKYLLQQFLSVPSSLREIEVCMENVKNVLIKHSNSMMDHSNIWFRFSVNCTRLQLIYFIVNSQQMSDKFTANMNSLKFKCLRI